MDLLGYCDPLCSRAGRPLSFHVSSRRGAPFRAEIVRLRQTDRSPEAPPFLTEPVPSELDGRQFAGRAQEIPTGAYVRVPHSPRNEYIHPAVDLAVSSEPAKSASQRCNAQKLR